jgi:hypothetical protein
MSKKSVAILFATLLISVNVQSSSATSAKLNLKQTATVKAYFAAIATSQPAKIDAGKKNAAANSAASKYLDLIQKHFTASEFFKVRDKFGNVSPLIQDPKGSYKLTKDVVTLNSYFDEIDGKYSRFIFNKAGKIVDFTFTESDGKSAKMSTNLYNAIIDSTNRGIKISSGYMWKKPNGTLFTQLKLTNIDAPNTSWSYAGTKYVAADGSYHDVSTRPIGCFTTKGVTYFEGTTATSAIVATKTDSSFVVPFYSGCDGGEPANRVLRVTLN